MPQQPEKTVPTEGEKRYFVNCPTDGVQAVSASDVNVWDKEMAKLIGKSSYATANCPVCHTTLSVQTS